MKRMFLLAAFASVALVSCTNENFYEQEMENQEISFVPVNKKQVSRALISGTAYPTDGKFGVYAWKGSSSVGANTQTYMTNAEVSLKKNYNSTTTSAWAPKTPYYWPKKDVLDFFAYSPFREGGTDITVTSSSSISIAHEVNQSKNQDVDLMYTNKVVNKKSNDASSGTSLSVQDGVSLTFNHALAQLKFNVKMKTINDGNTRTLTVNSIKLTGINSKGTLTFSGTDRYNVEWGNIGTSVNYENNGLNVTGIGTAGKDVIGTSSTAGWLILPQAAGGTLTVNVDIVTGTTTESNIDYTATMNKDTSISTWDMGKIYTYTITLNPVGDEILFVPSVTDWTAGTGALDSSVKTE